MEGEASECHSTVGGHWTVRSAYDAVVQWKKNFFHIPNNTAGKAFVTELTHLLQGFVDSRGTDAIALYRFMILPSLMLQMPTNKCSYKDANQYLRRRLDLWANEDLGALMDEGLAIQDRYRTKASGGRLRGDDDIAHRFGNCMSTGRVHQAIRMVSEHSKNGPQSRSGVLRLDDVVTVKDGATVSVRELLVEKHPKGQPAHASVLLNGNCPQANKIRFEAITPDLVRKVSRQCQGSAGPSGVDSDTWRRLCSSFKGASSSFCQAVASFARLIATESLSAGALSAFLSCRLIALDKRPGVRPIGVCEVLRRLVAKVVLKVVGDDVEKACGFLQKCSGCPAGLEAAVHAMHEMYRDESTEGILQVDARNAFNTLNRQVALHNVQHTCPSLTTILHNCYQAQSRLFVSGGGELASEEGVTQGDPLSMPFYALATLPLIEHLHLQHPAVRQIWLADDSAGAGRLRELRLWWNTLCEVGKLYGYYTNGEKTFLLVKPDLLEEAKQLFDGTGVQIVTQGVGYLGSAVGQSKFVASFVEQKVNEWMTDLETLTEFARTEPHAAFGALTHGLRSKYSYILRTVSTAVDYVSVIDKFLEEQLLPVLTGHQRFTADELALLRLPARLGGIGLPFLSFWANNELAAAKKMTRMQVDELLLQNTTHQLPTFDEVHKAAIHAKNISARHRSLREGEIFDRLRNESSLADRQLQLLSSKGVSAWLTALPLKEHGFWLSKRDFRDAMALRYDWQLDAVPVTCVCGGAFSANHAMTCAFGGYPTVRHNELRDFFGNLLTEVCHNVAVEPKLMPLNGEKFKSKSTNVSEEARTDIRATGFWTRCEEAFFDVRVFHADAPSYRSTSLEDLFVQHERRKQLEYEERVVNVDHGSFCPLVFSTTGATGPLCTRFLRRLAAQIADKNEVDYATTMAWIRCRVSFALIRNAVMCIRGSRSSKHKTLSSDWPLAVVESRIAL